MKFDANTPFNKLPALPPDEELDTKVILKQCIKARAALAELRTAAEMLPNQSVLINTLPLLEAQASSEIENIVTTTDKIFQYANSEENINIDSATKEALRYRTALREGFEALNSRPLNTSLAEKICSTLKGTDMNVRKNPGTTLATPSGKIIYTPPQGENLLREKLHNWEIFLHADNDLDPLIKMAIGHYQFEAIHPFNDGNGRTGRILNILYLIEQDLLTLPILYLSHYIIKHKADYYDLLLKVTIEQAWEEWIIYILKAVEETSKWIIAKIKSILLLMEETREFIRTSLGSIYTRELADLLFVQPYCRISNVVDSNIAKRQTASQYLKQLVSKGILHEIELGREKLFVNPRLMSLLLTDSNTYKKFQRD